MSWLMLLITFWFAWNNFFFVNNENQFLLDGSIASLKFPKQLNSTAVFLINGNSARSTHTIQIFGPSSMRNYLDCSRWCMYTTLQNFRSKFNSHVREIKKNRSISSSIYHSHLNLFFFSRCIFELDFSGPIDITTSCTEFGSKRIHSQP